MPLNQSVEDTLRLKITEIDEEIYSIGQQADVNRLALNRAEMTITHLMKQRQIHIDAIALLAELNE